MVRQRQTLLIGLILLAVSVCSFLYWGNRKQVWFCDEIYTYETANGFEQGWPASYVDEWMTGADVEAFFAADSESFSFDVIAMNLYSDHVPLYFWIFRFVSLVFFRGSGTIWIGLVINLFFYLFVTGLVYGLFYRLTGKPVLAGAVVGFTCIVNRLMLEQATTLRMYIMLLWAELLLLLTGFWILREVDRKKLSFWAYVCLFFVSVTGFLTHYDFWIFYAVTAALFCVNLLVTAFRRGKKVFWSSKEFRGVLAWAGNFVVSLLTTIGIFPYCRWNLNRGKGEMALNSIFDFSPEKLDHIRWGYRRLSASVFGDAFPVWIGLGVMFGCILGGVLILYRRKEREKLKGLTLTVLAAQAYQLIICFTLPDAEEERYLWGAFSIMTLCMAWGCILLVQACTARLKTARMQAVCRWIAAAAGSVAILIVEILVIDGGNGVAYLFYPFKDTNVLREYREVPWVVYGPTVGVYSYYDWIIPERICFLTAENTPEDVAAARELIGEEQFILYIYEDQGYYSDTCSRALRFLEESAGGEMEERYLMQSVNLAVYLITVRH